MKTSLQKSGILFVTLLVLLIVLVLEGVPREAEYRCPIDAPWQQNPHYICHENSWWWNTP